MRYIFLPLFFLISATGLAQVIEEVGPTYNNVLQSHYQSLENERAKKFPLPAISNQSVVINDNQICIVSGEVNTNCLDTDILPPSATTTCVNCADAEFGTVALQADTCLVYTSDTGVEYGREEIKLLRCFSSGTCDTLRFDYVVTRPLTYTTEPLTIVEAEEELFIDADTSNLPVQFSHLISLECNDPLLSHLILRKSEIFYTAKRFAGFDTICITINDRTCIADTVVYPFQIQQDTLDLPFMDDFSYAGPYPAGTHWLDKHTFVNNGFSDREPSVGVATFDGVDEKGSPYFGGQGSSDVLTSIYMDSRPDDPSNQVYITFWVQPKGRGIRPDGPDSLILELKQPDGVWRRWDSYGGIENFVPIDSVPDFQFKALVIPPSFQYDGFQFRFRNLSGNTGLVELWNLDYVIVEERASFPVGISDDLAFTTTPGSMLKRYTSMPWKHFKANVGGEIGTVFDVSIRNLFTQTNQLSGNGRITLREETTGISGLIPGQFITLLEPPPSFPPSQEYIDIRNLTQTNDYISNFQNQFPDTGDYRFITEYSFVSGIVQNSQPGFEAILRNDTVEQSTIFGNYFAYDDGISESHLVVKKAGAEIALEFQLNVPDSLRGIAVNFPHFYSNASDQLFNFRIWVDTIDNSPEHEIIFQNPFYANEIFDTLHGFTTYVLRDDLGVDPEPIALPAGKVYIGIQQASNDLEGLSIGFDKNNPEAKEFTYINIGEGWENLAEVAPTQFNGAVMIRPIFGSDTPVSTPNNIDEIPEELTGITIYPNPASNWLTVELPLFNQYDDYQLSIFNQMGQLVVEQVLNRQINISNLQQGMYVIKITESATGRSQVFKQIVTKF